MKIILRMGLTLMIATLGYSQPVVTITPSDPTATKAASPPDNGTFTITRAGGNWSLPLYVQFSPGGTAQSGDYQSIGTTAVIQQNQPSTTVNIIPTSTTSSSFEATVILTLQNDLDGRYTLGTPYSATLYLYDPRVTAPAPIPAPPGLIGWWPGQGNAADSAGNNNGSYGSGVTFIDGFTGQAFSFDGTGRVTVPSTSSLNFAANADFSIEAWIRPVTASTTFGVQSIVDKRDAPTTSSAIGYCMNLVNGKIAAQLSYAYSSWANYGPYGNDLRDGKWHHVVLSVVRNSSTGGNMYVDGNPVGTPFDPRSENNDLSNTQPLRIGNHATPNFNGNFKGPIDEVSLYRHALTATEVSALFGAGRGGKAGRPVIAQQPQNTTVNYGDNAVFSVTASAAAGLTYQWLKDGAPISGATASSYTVVAPKVADSNEHYRVNVSCGSLSVQSDEAILTVTPVSLIVRADNKWKRSGDPVPTLTGTISGLLPADSSSVGVTYSTTADQFSLPGPYPITPNIGGVPAVLNNYNVFLIDGILGIDCFPSAPCMVGWWQGEGNADDVFGINNGIVEPPSAAPYWTGEVGGGFSFGGSDVHVPGSRTTDVGSGFSFTVEGWIMPNDVSTPYPILAWNGVGSGGVNLWIGASSPGSLDANLRHLTSAGATADNLLSSPANQLQTFTFQHIALTYDAMTGFQRLFVNGVKVSEGVPPNPTSSPYPPLTSGELYFGFSPFGFKNGDSLAGSYYQSLLDEVGIYNCALSESEILAIYNMASSGKCEIAPTLISSPASQTVTAGNDAVLTVVAKGTSLQYNWFRGTTPVGSGSRSVLYLQNVQAADAGSYTVQIANNVGTITTAPANLTVVPPRPAARPPGAISWWRGEGDTADVFAINPGIPVGSLFYSAAKSGQGFYLDGFTAELRIPASPTLDGSSWTKTPNMVTARTWHTATLLDQRVLAAGGSGVGDSRLSSAELYDPATGNWTATVSMSVPRFAHTATRLADGSVLVAGGYDGSADLASCELYNPANGGSWAPMASMSVPRSEHTATLLQENNQVVVAGGSPGDSVELYNPGIGGWLTKSPMNNPRWDHAAVALSDGRILVAGGGWEGHTVLSSVEYFTPSLNSWTETASMNSPRGTPTITTLSNGKLLVIGGLDQPTAEIFDLASWSTTTMGTARYFGHSATVLPNGQVLVAGGRNNLANLTSTAAAEIFDPTIPAWRPTASLNVARDSHTATALPNGSVLVAGGYNSSLATVLSTAEIYSLGKGFTIEFWVNPNPNDPPVAQPLVEQWNQGSGRRFTLSYQSSSPGSLDLTYANASGTHYLSSRPAILRSSVFQHVALAVRTEAGNNQISLYLNGQLVASQTADLGIPLGMDDIHFGFSPSAAVSPQYFAGMMDEITIYDHALTPIEIQTIYNGGSAGKIPPCTQVPAGIVDWWQGEGNAVDVYNANPAIPSGSVTFTPGEAGQAFTLSDTAQLRVPASPTLRAATADAFTLEAWVNPNSVSSAQPILEWNSGFLTGVAIWLSDAGILSANIRDSNLGDNLLNGPQLTSGAFQHVALTYDRLASDSHLYLNGVAVAQIIGFPPISPMTSGDLYFGFSPYDDGDDPNFPQFKTGTQFHGQIDEVALYNRALTATEIKAIFAAGGGGKCAVAPAIVVQPASQTANVGNNIAFNVSATGTSLTYQWFADYGQGQGPQAISGANATTLTLMNVQLSQAADYSVRVANDVGAVTSLPATFVVNQVLNGTPPTIATQPQSQSACEGDTVSLNVSASGSGTLKYQWCKNTININGATKSSLTLSTIAISDAGSYTVVVYDSAGHITSGAASVSVHGRPSAMLFADPTPINPGMSAPILVLLAGSPPWNLTWSDGVVENGVTTSAHTRSVLPDNTKTYRLQQLSDANCTAYPAQMGGSVTITVSGPSLMYPKRVGLKHLSGSYTDFTFGGDQSVILDSDVDLYGTTTIEGGTVVKMPNSNVKITIHDPTIVCDTGPYRPAIFCAIDDDDFGYYSGDSTGDPEGVYGNGISLAFNAGSTITLKNLRFFNMGTGISVEGTGNFNFYDCQFIDCGNCIAQTINGANVNIYNALFSDDGAVFAPGGTASAPHLKFQHLTADHCEKFVSGLPLPSGTWIGANSLLVATTDPSSIPGTLQNVNNTCVTLASSSGVFQTGSDGSHYLAGSTYRGAGTLATIDSALLAEMPGKTTYPPITLPLGLETSGSMTLFPQIPRYVTGANPDLGYAYDVLDYTASCVILLPGANMTVLPGTAVGLRYDWPWAFQFVFGSSFVSQGTAMKPITFVPVSSVQEGPYPALYVPGFLMSFVPVYWPHVLADPSLPAFNQIGSPPPSLDFRFSNLYLNSGVSHHFWGGMANWFFMDLLSRASWTSAMFLRLQDCAVHSGWFHLGEPHGGVIPPVPFGPKIPSAVSLINNAFDRVNISLDPDTGPTWWGGPGPDATIDMSLAATNNLFRGGWLFMEPVTASAGYWGFENNLFDKVVFAQDSHQPLNYNYGAYWPCSDLELFTGQRAKLNQTEPTDDMNGANDLALLAVPPTYTPGPQGGFYLGHSAPLFGAGGHLAGDVGLFHYTTRADDQLKEGEETSGHKVNIGVHYVALNVGTGQPRDSDTPTPDGIPDYVEDANGNGVVDPNETSWLTTSDPLDPIYDDVDLDGDGMVGRIEKALAVVRNVSPQPLVPDNPLVLTQVPTGEEPDIATFRVNVSYASVNGVGNMNLLVQGTSKALVQPDGDGSCMLKWLTTFSEPGSQPLQARFVLNRQLQSSSSAPDSTVITAMGPVLGFLSNNGLQFDPFDSGYDDSNGATLAAILPERNARYTIELKTPAGTHIRWLATDRPTTSGEINEHWDLKDDGGAVYTGNGANAAFTVNFADAGPFYHTLDLSRYRTFGEGAFTVAYAWDNSYEAMHDLRDVIQYSVVDTLTMPCNVGFCFPWPYQSTFNFWTGYPGHPTGDPGWIRNDADVTRLVNNLINSDPNVDPPTRNFYFFGHGNPSAVGDGDQDMVHFTYNQVAIPLQNYLFALGRSTMPLWSYRFVFLQACSTANDNSWSRSFGIYDRISSAQLAARPERAQAFLGWVGLQKVPLDGELYDMADALTVFFSAWQNGMPLEDCIYYASQDFPPEPFWGYNLKWNFGPHVQHYNWYQQYRIGIGDPFLRIYGYAGLTRTGFVPGYDNSPYY